MSYIKGELRVTEEEPGQGLYEKFKVERLTESSRGIDHGDCRYFVLDPKHDAAARDALVAYANATKAFYPEISADIFAWLAEIYEAKAREED